MMIMIIMIMIMMIINTFILLYFYSRYEKCQYLKIYEELSVFSVSSLDVMSESLFTTKLRKGSFCKAFPLVTFQHQR